LNPSGAILDLLTEVLTYNFSFVLLQCLLLALYRMVLPVLILIHWGMGRFCLPFLASFCLILNVFRADMVVSVKYGEMKINEILALRATEDLKLTLSQFLHTTKMYKESQI